MKVWQTFLRILLFPLVILLFPCKVMNKKKYKKSKEGQVIISNHLSWMDVPYTLFKLPGFKRILSKKENGGGKFKQAFLRSIGVMFVNRDKPELSSVRECITSLGKGDTLIVYPEGTRNRVNRDLQELHPGAAMFALKAKATVIPVVVHHKGKIFRRNYIGVGDPVDLSDLFESRLNEATLKEATERFRAALQTTLDELDEWVATKGWKHKSKKRAAAEA